MSDTNGRYEAIAQALHDAVEIGALRITILDVICENLNNVLIGFDIHAESLDSDRAREIRAQKREVGDLLAAVSKICLGQYPDDDDLDSPDLRNADDDLPSELDRR